MIWAPQIQIFLPSQEYVCTISWCITHNEICCSDLWMWYNCTANHKYKGCLITSKRNKPRCLQRSDEAIRFSETYKPSPAARIQCQLVNIAHFYRPTNSWFKEAHNDCRQFHLLSRAARPDWMMWISCLISFFFKSTSLSRFCFLKASRSDFRLSILCVSSSRAEVSGGANGVLGSVKVVGGACVCIGTGG